MKRPIKLLMAIVVIMIMLMMVVGYLAMEGEKTKYIDTFY